MVPENRLLAGLPPDERHRILPRLDAAPLPRGKALFELGDIVQHAYFPTSGLISLLAVTPNDQAIELAMVGTKASSVFRSCCTARLLLAEQQALLSQAPHLWQRLHPSQ